MKIKNWEKFQHYKNRKPPWIRLYRDLLSDPDFFALSGDAAKHLVMLWLIASEDPEKEGNLPAIKKLAFRLRITEQKMTKSISELYHWVEGNASTALASGLQHATPDQIRSEADQIRDRSDQRQSESDQSQKDFDAFWSEYPRKVGKAKAKAAWDKAENKPAIDVVLQSLITQRGTDQWMDEQFIPHPASWINGERWADEIDGGIVAYIAGLEAQEREEEIIDAECTEI